MAKKDGVIEIEGSVVEALPNATFLELPRTDHAKTPKSFAFIDAALDFLRQQDG